MFDLVTAAEKAIEQSEKDLQELVSTANRENAENVAWEIISRFYISRRDMALSRLKVMEIYNSQCESNPYKIPEVDEVIEDIDAYNCICIERAVEVMMEYGYSITDRKLYESEESYISDSYGLWYDYFYSALSYEYGFELSEKDVMGILIENNVSFVIPSDDEAYDILGIDYNKEIIANDCQQTMLPAFSIAGKLAETMGQEALYGYMNSKLVYKERSECIGKLACS